MTLSGTSTAPALGAIKIESCKVTRQTCRLSLNTASPAIIGLSIRREVIISHSRISVRPPDDNRSRSNGDLFVNGRVSIFRACHRDGTRRTRSIGTDRPRAAHLFVAKSPLKQFSRVAHPVPG